MDTLSGREVVARCNGLSKYWNKRNTKFKDWYGLIQMKDTLKQKNMESFVGNDPRSSYNLILSMLDQRIPHKLPPKDISVDEVIAAAELSKMFDTAWDDVYCTYRRSGRYWLRDLIGFLIATGWYSVFATISLDGTRCISEVWNPATVFPSWGDDLYECAHIFPISAAQAKRMAARNEWTLKPSGSGKLVINDLWIKEGEAIYNTISLDNDLVKPMTHETRFHRIPIFTGPVGGLPDTGELAPPGSGDNWKAEIGQSPLAANERIYKYWNKWWSFSMQLLRDTAQPRTYEKSRSGTQIVKPEQWYKRGAHFKMAPEDEIGFIAPPAIPVELRSAQLDMEAMMQRGGPSWAMYGNVAGQMTSYVMSQITASTNQISKACHHGVVDCITDIDNFWFDMMKEQHYKPYGMSVPKNLPDGAKITASYELRIPGDLVNRATTARMLNPGFTLPEEMIHEELFPEVRNPVEAIAQVRAGLARKHPINVMISLVQSFREEAALLRKAKDKAAAILYERAAERIEAEITGEGEEAEGAGAARGEPGLVKPDSTTVPPTASIPAIPK